MSIENKVPHLTTGITNPFTLKLMYPALKPEDIETVINGERLRTKYSKKFSSDGPLTWDEIIEKLEKELTEFKNDKTKEEEEKKGNINTKLQEITDAKNIRDTLREILNIKNT